MRFDVVTLFPAMFDAITRFGITGRALGAQLWELEAWNPREYTEDPHRTVDDRPYGGGPGMVMMAEPLSRTLDAVAQARRAVGAEPAPVVYLSPQGRRFGHAEAVRLSRRASVTFLCGRYEGVDERLLAHRVDDEISIGDYVLSGGEIAAMVVIDAVVRQIPGAVGDGLSVVEESFVNGLLDCPQYTRPERWPADHPEGGVPEVLLSGHHERIRRWRLKESLARTMRKRPDLIAGRDLDTEQRRLLDEYRRENHVETGGKP